MKTKLIMGVLLFTAVSFSAQAQYDRKKAEKNADVGSVAKNQVNDVTKKGGGNAGKTSNGVKSEGVHTNGEQMKPDTRSIYDRPSKKSSSATAGKGKEAKSNSSVSAPPTKN
ncbi:hypothetical protein [Spirosoma rhododendri]|uniref:Uncharacterized protein n=1 Tax=Spirosoma rhododendri TaxID=2728024 RepID=A0A7L5DFY9_9BACT|nr:hypothetical protein [Spirosoma rhododendri]QJD77114.1 hypothetical protein HH216_00790 [Spirosoma rhododendri]